MMKKIHGIWLIRRNYRANNVQRIRLLHAVFFYCTDCNSITKIYCLIQYRVYVCEWVWVHMEYFSVCRWTVIVSLKRKTLETPLKMKSLLDRCSFIQFSESHWHRLSVVLFIALRVICVGSLYATYTFALCLEFGRMWNKKKLRTPWCPHERIPLYFRWRAKKKRSKIFIYVFML